MCTPTDRALAIEELEHLESKVKAWFDTLRASLRDGQMYPSVIVSIVTKDMEKEISK